MVIILTDMFAEYIKALQCNLKILNKSTKIHGTILTGCIQRCNMHTEFYKKIHDFTYPLRSSIVISPSPVLSSFLNASLITLFRALLIGG